MIKTAQAKHLDSVMAIWLNTNIAAHPFIPRSFWEGVFAQVKEAMPASDVFVYLEDDQVLGFIGITGNEYIAGLFVDGKAQSQGIGRKLLNHCKQLYPRLELDVFTENPGAVRFYQANGFEIVGTTMSPNFNREEHHMVWSACRTSMFNRQIRPATSEDVTAIFDVRCSVRENHMSREELAALDITPKTVREMITGGDYIVPVALIGEKIVGFAMAQISESYVFALFVRPEHEGKGLGRALMHEVESGLVEHGVTEASLCTGSEEGIRAPGFYRHLGWVNSGFMDDGQLKFCKTLT